MSRSLFSAGVDFGVGLCYNVLIKIQTSFAKGFIMKVWVVRHGESETNKDKLWTGWLDVSLTEKGKEDALFAREVLSKVKFDKVYTSDLKKAKNTAEIALPGYEYEETALIREINVGNIAGKEFSVVFDSNNRPMNEDGYGVFGGESKDEFCSRIQRFMQKLEAESGENIAVFAHMGVVRKFLDLVLGFEHPRKNIYCKNCAVAVFDCEDSKWALHSWINKI